MSNRPYSCRRPVGPGRWSEKRKTASMAKSSGAPSHSLFFLACGAALGIVLGSLWQAKLRRDDALLRREAKKSDLVEFRDSNQQVPENAPSGCPGLESGAAGLNPACEGCPNQAICSTGKAPPKDPHIAQIASRLSSIKHKILVLSGKGGVGKSTIATQIAWEIQARGQSVGLLDIDICGPSIPRMTGTDGQEVRSFGEGWLPVSVSERFSVMSTGFLLPTADGAVIWRGPKKNGLIRQFLTDVYWGDLDYLIVDTPPGTSDEHLSIVTFLQDAGVDGAIVVTTPQEVSLQDVRKEINFCKQTRVPVLGVVENMAGSVFSSLDPEAAKKTCEKMGVPYAGHLDLDQSVLTAGEKGCSIGADNRSTQQLRSLWDFCLAQIPTRPTPPTTTTNDQSLRVVSDGVVSDEDE